MNPNEQASTSWAACYRSSLLEDVIPFWLRHGWDRANGGFITSLDRDGRIVDTDKSIWFQGRSAWMFATLYNTVAPESEWKDAAQSAFDFLLRHGGSPSGSGTGKLYFTVTRDGKPLRMRRYLYSEAFAAIAGAALARATGDGRYAIEAIRFFDAFLRPFREPNCIPPKTDPSTRPMKGIGHFMICMATAQELRANLGDLIIDGRSCTEWIDWCIENIERDFYKPDLKVLMETVGPNGEVLDHFDGRQLNPGHAIECAWFILHESRRRGHAKYREMGLEILDWMWERGWDSEYGGLYYFRDVYGLPVQEYWHDMKFWWPHCEAIIATSLASIMTDDPKYASWHRQVHQWSFQHFGDPEHGEWYGYLHRDGGVSNTLKGSLWKGPFHLPRMLWYCWKLWEEHEACRVG